MFERFTDKARRVVVLAQEESRMMNHNYIGTEHLLLGLLHEGEGIGAKALASLDISLEGVRRQVEEIIGQGQTVPGPHIPFTPRAKKVLELSLRESKQLGHNYIGTEHILLGLIREGEGVAAQVLEKLGADLNRVRQQVVRLLSGFGGAEQVGERAPLGEEEAMALGVRQGEAAHAPLCPRCRGPLKDTAAYRVLDVPGPEGESSRAVTYVFCQRCGTWLGTLPPS
jgi:ATP-dependent Clp protease ATP-binding subunit ClpC